MKVALVTGANRGIGKEVAWQLAQGGLKVIIGSRDIRKGEKVVQEFSEKGINVDCQQLDVLDSNSITSCIEAIHQRYGKIDVLINNAGILLDKGISVLDLKEEILQKTIETNFGGALKLIKRVVPIMDQQKYGRIVNVSSGVAAFEPKAIIKKLRGTSFAYRLSKSMLNFLTYCTSAEVNPAEIKINAVCPGSVKTDMGGDDASNTVQDAVDTIIWLARLDCEGPTGSFFRNREKIPW